MQLSAVRLRTTTDCDALPACLEAILAAAGAEVDYGSLHAALGFPFWIAAPRRERCLGRWMTEGHDALLVETSRLFGFRVRELHPPEAAVGLEDSAEFLQHFEASYRPLMELALENGQAVLVRRGWNDACGNTWGVVTGRAISEIGFAGVRPGTAGVPLPLTAPPVQVYVVEDVQPRTVAPSELLRHVTEAARRLFNNGLDPRFGIITGPAAYDAWLARLGEGHICPCHEHNGAPCHARMAELVTRSRQAALQFLGGLQDVSLGSRTEIEAWESACRGVIHALSPSRDSGVVAESLRSESGRSDLADVVRAAMQLEAAR